jgi:hypothetical protein
LDNASTFVLLSIAIGAGATLLMDVWGQVQSRAYGVPPLDYAFVGRWLGHMTHGRFTHASIVRSTPFPGERLLGWIAHYLIGIAFAALLLAIFGIEWAAQPTLAPAMLVGLGTMAVPFLVMQPAFGMGIAASKTLQPHVARLRSLVTHSVFGLGLYLAGLSLALVQASVSFDDPADPSGPLLVQIDERPAGAARAQSAITRAIFSPPRADGSIGLA